VAGHRGTGVHYAAGAGGGAPVGRNPVERHQQRRRIVHEAEIMHEAGQVIESAAGIGHRPTVKLDLHLRYPLLQSLMIPAEDPDYGDLGPAFPPWPAPARDAILQSPKPEIQPLARTLERAMYYDMDMDMDMEAAS
jgi:hypothetical protein